MEEVSLETVSLNIMNHTCSGPHKRIIIHNTYRSNPSKNQT